MSEPITLYKGDDILKVYGEAQKAVHLRDGWREHGKEPPAVVANKIPDVITKTNGRDKSVYPNEKANATKSAIELADKHGLLLWSIADRATGKGGKITLNDVKKYIRE